MVPVPKRGDERRLVHGRSRPTLIQYALRAERRKDIRIDSPQRARRPGYDDDERVDGLGHTRKGRMIGESEPFARRSRW